jgi:hypothetical protein
MKVIKATTPSDLMFFEKCFNSWFFNKHWSTEKRPKETTTEQFTVSGSVIVDLVANDQISLRCLVQTMY